MDFGDLIPLLIIVGSLVVSAISGINKTKKQANDNTPRPAPAPRPQPKPARPMTVPQQQPRPVVQPQRKPIHQHPQSLQRDQEMQAAINKLKKEVTELQKEVERGKRQTKKPETSKRETLLSQEQDISPALGLNNLDEMKKAVIYSEIINRKFF